MSVRVSERKKKCKRCLSFRFEFPKNDDVFDGESESSFPVCLQPHPVFAVWAVSLKAVVEKMTLCWIFSSVEVTIEQWIVLYSLCHWYKGILGWGEASLSSCINHYCIQSSGSRASRDLGPPPVGHKRNLMGGDKINGAGKNKKLLFLFFCSFGLSFNFF